MIRKELDMGDNGFTKIIILCDPEQTTISITRGNIEKWSHTINKHPKLLESIFPSCVYNMGMTPLLANESEKEVIYRSRIKRCLQIDYDFAQTYIKDDLDKLKSSSYKKAKDYENTVDFYQFINMITELKK